MTDTQDKSPPHQPPDGWEVAGRRDGLINVKTTAGLPIANVFEEIHARLIVLAPELRDTLDFVRGWFVDNNLDDEYYAIFEVMCETLAKLQVRA